MKRVAILVVFLAVPMFAQAPSLGESMNKLSGGIDKLIRVSDLKSQMEEEYLQMSLELASLHDERVDEIMRPHINRVETLNRKVLATAKGLPK